MTTARTTTYNKQRTTNHEPRTTNEFFVLFLCVGVFLAFAPFTPGFVSSGNLANILIACLPLLVLATGQTVVLITAGIDLSVTAIIGLASVVGALVMGGEAGWLRGSPAAMPVAVAAMLATGVLVGFLNGACIAWLRMPAFMVTLTSTMFFSGLAVWMAKTAVNAESIYNLPDAFLVLGRQTGLAVLLVSLAVLLAHLLLTRTLLGRWICAVGHNPRTALISGVPVGGVTVSAYIISGLFAAVAAIVLTSRLETGSPNHGKTLLLDVIGAAVIGGTSLFGGKGKVSWTVCGVLFLALLGNGLNLLDVSDFLITIIKGVVILVAALLDVWRNQWTRGSSPSVRRIEGMSSAPTSHEPRATGSEPVVSFAGIEKSFFGVRVLKRVSFDVGAGRIVGLVGENGAGKSTLMNLLGGNLRPDAGELRVAGRRYAPNDPNEARASGIAFVHQELNLFPNLSIAENLFLSNFPLVVCRWWIARRALRSRTTELLQQVGLGHAPEVLVDQLPAGERQLVEIAKALGADARVIILDEPTTSLSARECERLFRLVNQLRQRGIAIIYISHALGDVLRLCDDLVVLRDGEVVGGGAAKEFTHNRLVSLMVGRQLNQLYPERRAGGLSADSGEPPTVHPDNDFSESLARCGCLLQVHSVSQPGVVRDLSFSLAAGEVLGIFGLMGAGRSELARMVFGLDPHSSGEFGLGGNRLEGNPRRRIRRGLAFLTEDRRQDGLCMGASIADNMSLVTLARYSWTPARWLDVAGIRSAVSRMREAVRLSPGASDAQPVRTLSGGNQQKVVLGKWLMAEPRVLILDEPTRGIDVGAKFEIYQLIHQRADRGAGVVVISSEIEELIGICDRILVMSQGAVAGEFPREHYDREILLAAALPSSKSAAADATRIPSDVSVEEPAGQRSLLTPAPVEPPLLRLLGFAPVILLAIVLIVFVCLSGKFLTADNLTQVLVQSSATAIVATGMTFVLLTAGVDLSVGAIMFVGAGLAGKLALAGQPLPLCLAVMVAVGLAGGAVNALLVTRLKLVAFIATLATLYIGRGTGRWITETRAMNLPDVFLAVGSAKWLGVPLPLWIAGGVILLAQVVLSHTPLGRQLYALGNNPEAAKKAGLRTTRLLTAVYLFCGLCAGLGGILALAQLGAVSPRFGELYEFDAITAAVLGGTSLFGGRGKVFPGTVLGAVLLKSIFNGLVIVQADPYLYPLITSGIVFAAVLLDSLRQRLAHNRC